MNRVEIKEEAKAKVKGNIWNILWPLLVIGIVSSIISSLLGGSSVNINVNDLEELSKVQISPMSTVSSGVVSIITGIIAAGYIKYLLNFVRTGKFDSNAIINTIKEKWLDLLIAGALVYVIVGVCTLLLVVPGIIMGIAYTFVDYLIIDKDVPGSDSLKASREMMKGYKWDYFVFNLSFIGWILLVPFTLGILLVWLVPYMQVAEVLYYENLKKISK